MSENRNVLRWLCLCLCACTAWSVPAGAGENAGIEAITRPSEDITMSFVRQGQIAEITVKKGDTVKAGQLLAAQDQKVEQAELLHLKAQADDTIRVDAQMAQLAQKKVDLRKLEEAAERGAATKWEVEHARLDVTIAELSVKLARFERAQAKRKYEQAALQIERMKLCSPIDGTVEELYKSVGEAVGGSVLEKDRVLRLVRIDPLWIDVPVPTQDTERLSRGDSARVEFGGRGDTSADGPAPLRGKIAHIAAVGDAASATVTVRVEAPNPDKRRAGERVIVFFGQPEKTAAPAPPRKPASAGR